MKIVLTSCGIINEKLKHDTLSLFDKDIKRVKGLYITTAIDGENSKDQSWIEEEYNSIINFGILKENITEYKIGNPISINEYDAIYMLGGNTFYLMAKIREYNFDKIIYEALKNNTVYIGSSAGSIVLGKTVEIALNYDENEVNLTDYSALNIVDGVVIPHANRKQKFIEKYKKVQIIDLLLYTMAMV